MIVLGLRQLYKHYREQRQQSQQWRHDCIKRSQIQCYNSNLLHMETSPIYVRLQHSRNVLLPAKVQDLCQFEVICRVRPIQQPQIAQDIIVSPDKSIITMISQSKNLTKEFSFNRIYNEDTSQQQFTTELTNEIFNNCRKNGKGSLVFSYGVTNSGKTYTILGTEEEPGLLPRIIYRIEQEYPQETITITAIEAYNDDFYSLKNKQKLVPNDKHGIYDFAQYEPEQITKQSTKQMIQQYITNRNQSDTKSNKMSSRSHAIFKIQCDQISLAIVDLAGSERLDKASSSILETTFINGSLLVLGKCIHAFRDNTVIPFRESKLTKALVEYFSPSYKIYMIAHLNRSSLMFHQNIKVLEYAAVSSKVRQLNPHMNKSIVKSAKKRMIEKSKSCLKSKDLSLDDQTLSRGAAKSPVGWKPIKKQERQEKQEREGKQVQLKQLDEMIQDQFQKNRRMMMERYINQMIGRNAEFDYYLDHQFQKEDLKDREFIEELNNARYVSPQKMITVNIQLAKAQSRIRLRKQILQEIQRQKRDAQQDYSTSMGPSMHKCLEESIRRKWKSHGEEVSGEKENQQPQIQPYFSIKNAQGDVVGEQLSQENTTTPPKSKLGEQQSQSYFKKVLNQSKKLINLKSSVTNAIDSVVNFIRSQSKRKSMKRHSAPKRRNLTINQQFVVNFREQKPQNLEIMDKKLQKKQRGVGSFNISEVAQSNSRDQHSEGLSQLLKDLQSKSTVESDEFNNSMLMASFDNYPQQQKQMKTIQEIRESDEYQNHKKSPCFKAPSQHDNSVQSSQGDNQIQSFNKKRGKRSRKAKSHKNQHPQQRQQSKQPQPEKYQTQHEEQTNSRPESIYSTTWDKSTSNGSSQANYQKSHKPHPSRKMNFVFATEVKLSPLQTRSQRGIALNPPPQLAIKQQAHRQHRKRK